MTTDFDNLMDLVDNDEKVRAVFEKGYQLTKATEEELDELSDNQTLALTVLSVAYLEKEYLTGMYVLCNADDIKFISKVSEAVARFVGSKDSQDLRDFHKKLEAQDA